MSASGLVLVLNCGSSSIKFALFAAHAPLSRTPWWRGQVQGIGGETPQWQAGDAPPEALALDRAQPHHAALACIRARVLQRLEARRMVAVAHRVVHGGSKYLAPTRVDGAVLADLRDYVPLAPLHQPFALEAI